MRTLFLIVVSCVALIAGPSAARSELDPNRMMSHALSFRLGFIFDPAMQAHHLEKFPNTEQNTNLRYKRFEASLWSHFMEGAIVKLGHLPSEAPVVMYYNPLVDVAVLTVWAARPRRYDLTSFRAVPGERIRDGEAGFALAPDWRLAERPLGALRESAAARLATFGAAYPVESARIIRPSPPDRPGKIASQAGAEARLLAYVDELNQTAARDDVEQIEAALRAAASDQTASDQTAAAATVQGPARAVLAGLPEAARRLLTVRHALTDGGAAAVLFGFPQRPRSMFVAKLDLTGPPRVTRLSLFEF